MHGVSPEGCCESVARRLRTASRVAGFLKPSLNDYWLGHPSNVNKPPTEAWLFHGRIVEMVDGWTVTMADTPENQEEYPQMTSQKPGCGFPIARMIGVFSLATGAINLTALGAYKGKQTGETSLLRSILDRILPGRILY